MWGIGSAVAGEAFDVGGVVSMVLVGRFGLVRVWADWLSWGMGGEKWRRYLHVMTRGQLRWRGWGGEFNWY